MVSTLTDNFGIEAWVNPDVAVGGHTYVIAFNGAGNGWGIYQSGSTYSGLLGGVGTVGSGTATVGTWTHVALVRSGGVATFYVNGVPSGATSATAPLTPTIGFAIGSTAQALPSQAFSGAIDEVRVFTFEFDSGGAGHSFFSTNDLLVNLQRVTTGGVLSFGPTNATLAGAAYPAGLPTTAWFEWGTTTNYGNATPALLFGGQAGSTNFTQAISNLQFTTTYHFHAVVSNALGIATGADSSFTTTGPSVQTLAATGIDATVATLNAGTSGSGGGSSTGWFQWGTTTNYGNTTAAQPVTTLGVSFSQGLNGLAAGTAYQFRAIVSNSLGVATGSNLSFTTLLPLTVSTQPASSVGTNSATMNGTANPGGAGTFGYFEYGATTNYASTTSQQSLGSGTGNTNFSFVFAPVTGGQTYHYRADATRNGTVTVGGDQSFIVPAFPIVTTLPATGPSNGLTFTLNGTVNPEGVSAAAWFEWGTTTNYGTLTATQAVGGGSSNTNFSQSLTGLTTGVYHYRASASNVFSVVHGTDQSFDLPVFVLTVTNLFGVYFGSANWGDFDNDGRLDVLLHGSFPFQGRRSPTAQLWLNTAVGFTFNANAFPIYPDPLASPIVACADYDNDGWLDILVSGVNADSSAMPTRLWRNVNGLFTNVNTNIYSIVPGLAAGSAAWGDYNNDGLPDFLLTGYSNADVNFPGTGLWQNFNSSVRFENAFISFPAIGSSSVAWGDYDNDGRLDILLSGMDSTVTNAITQVWRNTGSGFSNINAGLPGIQSGSVAWGDFDNDGRLDILLSGADGTGANAITQVWRNTGGGFTNINAGLPGVFEGSVAWGDYDNDGRLDILITGQTTNGQPISQIWRNTGSGFTNINAGLPGVFEGSVAWGDYDNDGRLDILITGQTTNGQPISQIWRNNTPATNTPPTVPTGLKAVLAGGNGLAFSWNAAGDTQTPGGGLTYNLRVGTTPGGCDIVSPMSASNGFRLLPQMGNAQETLFRTIVGLPLGQTIYWSVQAVDTAFAGGPFAAEKTVTYNTVLTPPNGVPVAGDTNGDGIVSQAELAAVLANLNGNGIVSQSELDLVLSNYFPYSPFLLITNVAGLGGTNVTFSLSNSTAGAFSVEYSTNLLDWQFLGPATPLYEFFDTNAPAIPQRYYRLRWP